MEAGEEQSIEVPPELGYGEYQDALASVVPQSPCWTHGYVAQGGRRHVLDRNPSDGSTACPPSVTDETAGQRAKLGLQPSRSPARRSTYWVEAGRREVGRRAMCYPCTQCGTLRQVRPQKAPTTRPPATIPCLACGAEVDPATGACCRGHRRGALGRAGGEAPAPRRAVARTARRARRRGRPAQQDGGAGRMAGGPHPLGGGCGPPRAFRGDGRCPPRAPRPPAVPCDRRGRLPQSHATGTGVACRAPRGHPLQSHAAGMGRVPRGCQPSLRGVRLCPPRSCCQQAHWAGTASGAAHAGPSAPTAAAPWESSFPALSQMDHRQFRGYAHESHQRHDDTPFRPAYSSRDGGRVRPALLPGARPVLQRREGGWFMADYRESWTALIGQPITKASGSGRKTATPSPAPTTTPPPVATIPAACCCTPRTASWRSIEGDPLDPYANGKLCMRCLDMIEMVEPATDRLKYPMKRAGERGENKWERITWDEAYRHDQPRTSRKKSTTRACGRESILVGHGTGRNINWQVPFIAGACFRTANVGGIYFSGLVVLHAARLRRRWPLGRLPHRGRLRERCPTATPTPNGRIPTFWWCGATSH